MKSNKTQMYKTTYGRPLNSEGADSGDKQLTTVVANHDRRVFISAIVAISPDCRRSFALPATTMSSALSPTTSAPRRRRRQEARLAWLSRCRRLGATI
jgi:hypothetical protein